MKAHSPCRRGKLYLVFEFVDMNLLELISEYYPDGFTADHVRQTVWQMVRAVEYCHRHDVIHRDIKPENLLVNLSDMTVKLCDFGFARTIPIPNDLELTDYVATRWYRAPELLLGCLVYGPEVDMFAIGCVMGEIVDGGPLLPGESELDQLSLLQSVIGPLTVAQLEIFSTNPRYVGMSIPARPSTNAADQQSLDQRFAGKLSRRGLGLMKAFLEIRPARRISADMAMRDMYFDGIARPLKHPPKTAVGVASMSGTATKRPIGLPPRVESRQSSTESIRRGPFIHSPASQPAVTQSVHLHDFNFHNSLTRPLGVTGMGSKSSKLTNSMHFPTYTATVQSRR